MFHKFENNTNNNNDAFQCKTENTAPKVYIIVNLSWNFKKASDFGK